MLANPDQSRTSYFPYDFRIRNMNILFIIKVHIIVLITWSYTPHPHSPNDVDCKANNGAFQWTWHFHTTFGFEGYSMLSPTYFIFGYLYVETYSIMMICEGFFFHMNKTWGPMVAKFKVSKLGYLVVILVPKFRLHDRWGVLMNIKTHI